MQKYTVIEKNLGETPLEAVERWRTDTSTPSTIPLAYAGRLDPMATGKLLVLMGEECKRQETYHNLDKEYEFEVLFGFNTDTFDVVLVNALPQSLQTK
jgi:tRNA U55 pseudouridine synthase TruB